MTLGEKIKTARIAAGLTQAQLAERLMVSRPAVTKWEADKGIPDIDNLKLIAHCLHVSLDDLLADEPLTVECPSFEAGNPRGEPSESRATRPKRPMLLGRIASFTLLVDLLATCLAYWLIKDASAVVLPLMLTFLPLFLYCLWMPGATGRTCFIGGGIACAAFAMALHSALYAVYTRIAYGEAAMHMILWKDLLCLTGGMLLLEMAMMLLFLLSRRSPKALSVWLGYAVIVALTLICTAALYIPIGTEALPAECALLLGSVALAAGICRVIFVSKRNTDTDV